MRLYLGSRDYRPDGFLTVDIDPTHNPDILADVADMTAIAADTVTEICASHILEHLPWPVAFKALTEWTRILKTGGTLRLGVPDLAALGALVASGRNSWAAAGLIYGLGRRCNRLEAHQYGYTRDMIVAMLRALGFGAFGWWKHDIPDASNGWTFDEGGHRIAVSLNISAKKLGSPVVDTAKLLDDLLADPMMSFEVAAARRMEAGAGLSQAETDPLLAQRLHYALIEARMRILYLENELREARLEPGKSEPHTAGSG